MGRAKRNPSSAIDTTRDGFRKGSTHPTALSDRRDLSHKCDSIRLIPAPMVFVKEGAAMSFRRSSSRTSSSRSRLQTDRRRFIGGAGASLIGLAAAPALLSGAFAQGRRWSGGDPFSLGVASGAPRPDGFVLWTRLAPDPLSPDPATPGGMTGGDLPVTYEIAGEPAMRDIVRRGTATAERRFGYSVHTDVRGLPPGRSYCHQRREFVEKSPV
jgi:PhoD-like phosphatase, N-terminal domain